MACFFLEFAKVSFWGISTSGSGFEFATTISLHENLKFDEEDTPNPYLIVSFLCILFGFGVVWEAQEHNKKMTVSACFAAAGVVFLLLFRTTFASLSGMEGYETLLSLEFGLGWTLSTLACSIAACVSFITGSLSTEKSNTQALEQDSHPSVSDDNVTHRNISSPEHKQPANVSAVPQIVDSGTRKVIIRDSSKAGLGGEWVLTKFPCFIGRDISVVQVLVSDSSASGVHAKLYIDAGAVMISDEHSLNGTFVNGEKINGPTELLTGDVATIGKTTLFFEVSE